MSHQENIWGFVLEICANIYIENSVQHVLIIFTPTNLLTLPRFTPLFLSLQLGVLFLHQGQFMLPKCSGICGLPQTTADSSGATHLARTTSPLPTTNNCLFLSSRGDDRLHPPFHTKICSGLGGLLCAVC